MHIKQVGYTANRNRAKTERQDSRVQSPRVRKAAAEKTKACNENVESKQSRVNPAREHRWAKVQSRVARLEVVHDALNHVLLRLLVVFVHGLASFLEV